MKKLAASAFVLSLLSSAAIAADPVKIGFLSTFSGPGGQLGQELLDGFNLALEENGKTIGGRPVEIIAEDDGTDPKRGAEVVEKFASQHNCDIAYGTLFSHVVMGSAPQNTSSSVLSTTTGHTVCCS